MNLKYIGKNLLRHTLELKKGNVSGSVSSTGSFGAGFIDNKLGIGTTAPDTELHIAQGSAGSVDTHANYILTLEGSSDVIMQFQTPNNRDSVGIVFGDPDDQDVGRVIYDHTADTLNLFAAGAQQFRLASNKLTIGNNFNNNSGVLNVAPGSGTSPTMFFEQYTSATDGTLGEISFGNRAVDGQLALIQVKNDGANDSAYMAFHTEVTSGALTERLRIHSAGTVEFKGANQLISGSITSTGSFGHIESAGNFLPKTDNAVDLGSSARRWANVFVGDLVLSNEGSGGNEIDGTEGNWIVQEGEENLYLLNKKNGKKYKFKLEEVE